MLIDIQRLSDAVQFNCDVADANYAGNYTMCTYLLKMRELYRWSEALEQSDKLQTSTVSGWVESKEAYWSTLEDEQFRQLPIAGLELEPFDVEEINKQIADTDLIYGAGYGRGCRPEFYLATLLESETYESFDLYISGKEYVRDLSASVAMTQGEKIYVRQESVQRMMWEQIEAWRWRKSPDGALSRALALLPLDEDPVYSLAELVSQQMEQVINHEIGEIIAGRQLGKEWESMIVNHSGARLEFLARAIRDHIADVLSTLPVLIETENEMAIHLYFSNFNALRRLLFPQLVQAYEKWCLSKRMSSFKQVIRDSQSHWISQAEKLLLDYEKEGTRLVISDNEISNFQPTFSVH